MARQHRAPRLGGSDGVYVRILLGAGSVVLTWLVAELGFRRFFPDVLPIPRRSVFQGIESPWSGPPLRRWQNGYVDYLPGSSFRLCYHDNPRGYFDRDGCVSHSINSWGYRDLNHEDPAAPGTIRVALLGDSFTLGEGVRDEDVYSRLVGQSLKQTTQRKVEVLNFGMSGDDTRRELERYRSVVRRVRPMPKEVVMQWNTNDIPLPPVVEAHSRLIGVRYMELFDQAPIPGMLGHFLWLRWKSKEISDELFEINEGQLAAGNLGFEWIAELKQAVVSDGARFRVLIFPEIIRLKKYPYSPLIHALLQFCRTAEIEVLNPLPLLSAHEDNELWVHATDHHPNELAHRLVAEELAKVLRSRTHTSTFK